MESNYNTEKKRKKGSEAEGLLQKNWKEKKSESMGPNKEQGIVSTGEGPNSMIFRENSRHRLGVVQAGSLINGLKRVLHREGI